MAKKRSKHFATVVYPESTLLSSMFEFLGDLKISYLVSPPHDSDYDEQGNLKKAHFHIILVFDSLKSFEQVQSLLSSSPSDVQFCGLEIVNSFSCYARYLCHLDNPDKAQYDVNGVVAFGIDYFSVIVTKADKFISFVSLLDFIESNPNLSFADLCFYARHNNPDMLQAIMSNSYTVRELLRSPHSFKS